jgi:DNA (cytosine-5)-methyltransferase 1
MIQAVDLFCGAGGLTAGLIKAGIDVPAGYDLEGACSYAYSSNNGSTFVQKDVAGVTREEILNWYQPGRLRLLAGCAPCQPFSTYNQGKDATQDKKWPLLYQFSRLIKESAPELVTMENVPDVTKHQVYQDFVKNLGELGYYVWEERVRCEIYGLPQIRRRHVLLASKLGPIELIPATHTENYVSVREAIANKAILAAGEANSDDPLHATQNLSVLNLQRIKASLPGGTWKDWPEHLRAKCHNKPSGKSYVGVYGRMEWDAPSPTITTLCYGYGNGRFGHPEQDRALSLREASILQSFPDDYSFQPESEKVNFKAVGKMIGNAVPVRLGEVIGLSFINHVKKYLGEA